MVSSVGIEDGPRKNSASPEVEVVQQNEMVSNTELKDTKQQDKYSVKYHNFLTSYFLQESSVERTNKKSEEKGQFMSRVKDFHSIIISRKWSLF